MPSDVVYDAVLGSLTLKQVQSASYSGGGNPIAGTASGNPDPDTYFGGTAEPRASFSSADIATILGVSNICTAGLAVAAGTVTIPFQKRANRSTFAGGSSNNTLSAANGLLVPNTFSVSQDDDAAMCSLDFIFKSTDGTTNPVTITASQALSAQSFTALFGL
ncbi:MAG TPA: hypothetical protein VLA12_03340, partial [Planctomycetaceae bacterium]|nr:hypothetical protein [Planctomycetaceae bacterium]